MDSIKWKTIITLDDLCQDLKINLQLYEIFVNDKKESGPYMLNKGDNIETRLRKENRSIQLAEEVAGAAPANLANNEEALAREQEAEEISGASSEAEPSITAGIPVKRNAGDRLESVPEIAVESIESEGRGVPETETVPPVAGTQRSLLVYLNGRPMYLPPKADGMPHFFVDMFSYVDIDTQNPQGALVQTVNGQEAPYLQELFERDEICIHWTETE
ncbi:hypothetical protein SDC9_175320 [bioreactor metagenome]|uniref:Uncharacterized protein n=1 Tax=bioreactor metagenome TaxID=1076179 RepID=A0A645GNX8_9ZZZZ